MAGTTPYAQLVGPVDLYLAPYGEPEPPINATPGGNWVRLGATEGDQVMEETGDLTKFYDNDHQGPVKVYRGQEDMLARARLVDLTLEHLARIKRSIAAITAGTSGGANVKRLPIKKGAIPTEYALLMRGAADSPYGNYPGQTYIPRGVFEGNGTRTRSKTARDAVDIVFHGLEDDAQSEDNKLGWSTVQTS